MRVSRLPIALLLPLTALALAAAVDQIPLGLDVPSKLQLQLNSESDNGSSTPPSYRDTLLSLHKALVEIPSISGTENKVGRFLVEYLTSRGYVAQLQFLPPKPNTPAGAERFNVVAWPGPTRNPSPRVLVTSHIDVVPPYIPYAISSDDAAGLGPDTRISGRGSVDAKGSVAAQIVAVEELLARRHDADDRARVRVKGEDLMLLFVVGEETSGDGMRFFSDSLDEQAPPPRFEAAIFGEPTENRLACGHKGIAVCEARARGRAGHSGYPWLGKSANEVLARALVKVLDADLGRSERFGNTTVNIGRMEGGVAANVIPKEASAMLAIRIGAGNQSAGADVVKAKVARIFEEVDAEALSLECSQGYGPVVCNCDVPGFDPIAVNYGTDVPNLKGDHVRYLYGPGNIFVAHGDDEALTVGDLERAVEGYKRLIQHALRG